MLSIRPPDDEAGYDIPIMRSELPVSNPAGTDVEMPEGFRRATFDYFRNEVHPRTGLIADKTQPGSPSSIAAVGMALSVYVVAIERELLSRAETGDRRKSRASYTSVLEVRSAQPCSKSMPGTRYGRGMRRPRQLRERRNGRS